MTWTCWQEAFGRWRVVQDGDPLVFAIASRHYSFRHYQRKRRRDKRVVGPGERLILLTSDGKALCIWKKFRDQSGQQGICCALFRNEGADLSSALLIDAETLVRLRWPDERRLYTYVDPRKIKSTNPGYCFQMAGWKKCGQTRGGLIILEKILDG